MRFLDPLGNRRRCAELADLSEWPGRGQYVIPGLSCTLIQLGSHVPGRLLVKTSFTPPMAADDGTLRFRNQKQPAARASVRVSPRCEDPVHHGLLVFPLLVPFLGDFVQHLTRRCVQQDFVSFQGKSGFHRLEELLSTYVHLGTCVDACIFLSLELS